MTRHYLKSTFKFTVFFLTLMSFHACVPQKQESQEDHLKRRALSWIGHLKLVIPDQDKATLVQKLENHLIPSPYRKYTANYYYDHWKSKPNLPHYRVDSVDIKDDKAKVHYYYEWEKRDKSGIRPQKETLDWTRVDGEWYRHVIHRPKK